MVYLKSVENVIDRPVVFILSPPPLYSKRNDLARPVMETIF